jgi:hypothetical protein
MPMLVLLTVLSCHPFAALAMSTIQPPRSDSASHPRLLLNPGRIATLKSELVTSHKFLWERYQQDLPRMIGVAKGKLPLEDVRYAGDLVPELAFAWLMTGDTDLLATSKTQLLKLTSDSSWTSDESLSWLVPSHFLFGIALGYDWLYKELSPQERGQVSARLGAEAERQYLAITAERVWWRNQYFQNHSHSNTCGLAFAATALSGEDTRAQKWLVVCDMFFQKVFDFMPLDGGSLEGYSYGGYGGEYLIKYALLAKEQLGKDYSSSLWMRNFSRYLLHGLLPFCTSREWAMTFGDGPRRGWTSTAQHLFVLARLYRDPVAQWMGEFVVRLYPQGLGSHGWMMVLYFDPSVGVADPADFTAFHHFPEIGQVMMRSAWTDPDAMLVGFKCGPFMGNRITQEAPFDYGTGHQGADSGAFQVFANRQFWAIDPLYPGYKLTANYNTMLFKGVGQLGEQAAFGSAEALRFGHFPQIIKAESGSAFDMVVGDVARAYHPALGLKKFRRHLLFVKPDVLLVADELKLDNHGMVYNFSPETLSTTGGLRHAPNDYVVGPEGQASVLFEGYPGNYQLMAVYLDNQPGVGRFSFEVDGENVYSWISQNQEMDDHLVAVSPEVRLNKGSRIAFRATPMSEGCRLVKMAAFSPHVIVPQRADWLMHFDPQAAIHRDADRIQATMGSNSLDFYSLVSTRKGVHWATNIVKKADLEPFTFRETQRLELDPPFIGDSAFVLVMLHSRINTSPAFKDVSATVKGQHITAGWVSRSGRISVEWDLARQKAELIGK